MLTRSTLYMCRSITRMTELTLITAIPLSSRLSQHQNSRAWQCHGVSGSLAICDLSPAASRRFPVDFGDTADATCAQISSLDAVRAVTAACTMR